MQAGTLVLWTVVVFLLMLCTFGIGAASGDLHPSIQILYQHHKFKATCIVAMALPC